MGNRSKCQSYGAFGKKVWLDIEHEDDTIDSISVVRPNRRRDLSKHIHVKRAGRRSISISELTSSLKAKGHISTNNNHRIDISTPAKKQGILGRVLKIFQRKVGA